MPIKSFNDLLQSKYKHKNLNQVKHNVNQTTKENIGGKVADPRDNHNIAYLYTENAKHGLSHQSNTNYHLS